METSRRVRTLGWIMLFLGIFLAGFMGYISWYLYPTMANPGKEIGGTTYTGTTEAATKFFGIFALVIFLGLVSIAGGIWQITTGRRSRIVMLIAMIFAAILITAAWLVEFGLLGD